MKKKLEKKYKYKEQKNNNKMYITYTEFIKEGISLEYQLEYEKWKWGGYSDGYPSWVLYKDNEPVVAISNDTKDRNHVIIRHIEAFVKGQGYAQKLIFMLLDEGVTLETGKPDYNSISTSAYYMNKKIVDAINKTNGKYKAIILGKANNEGKEEQDKYEEVSGDNTKLDNFHYKFEKS